MRLLFAAFLSAALLPAADAPLVGDAYTRNSLPASNTGALPQLAVAPGESTA